MICKAPYSFKTLWIEVGVFTRLSCHTMGCTSVASGQIQPEVVFGPRSTFSLLLDETYYGKL